MSFEKSATSLRI